MLTFTLEDVIVDSHALGDDVMLSRKVGFFLDFHSRLLISLSVLRVSYPHCVALETVGSIHPCSS